MEELERGLLAIKLLKIATATRPELTAGDENYIEYRKAWRFAKQLLSAAEIASFEEMLRHYGDWFNPTHLTTKKPALIAGLARLIGLIYSININCTVLSFCICCGGFQVAPHSLRKR